MHSEFVVVAPLKLGVTHIPIRHLESHRVAVFSRQFTFLASSGSSIRIAMHSSLYLPATTEVGNSHRITPESGSCIDISQMLMGTFTQRQLRLHTM